MEAIVYARFSRADQARGHSIERQIDNAKAVCAYRELVPIRTEIEKGKSAFSGANRAKGSLLANLEREIEAGKHKGRVLVVEHLDRISRQGHDEVTDFLKACSAGGVSVATHDGMSFYPAGERVEMLKVIEIILKSELAREESAKKSRRVRDSFAEKREAAEASGEKRIASRPPSWIRKLPKGAGFELIPERAAIVREAHRLAQNGYGTTMIAKTFNERGYPTWRPNSQGWHESYIQRMLMMRTAIGEFVSPTYRKRILGYYPAVVSPLEFERTQAVIASRRKRGGRRGNDQSNLFSGIPRCAKCGGRMTMATNRQVGKVSRRVFRSGNTGVHIAKMKASYLGCELARRKVSDEAGNRLCFNRKTVRYEFLEPAVLDELMTVAFASSDIAAASDTRLKLADVDHRLGAAREQAANLGEALKQQFLPTLVTMLATVEGEIESLLKEQDELTKELSREGGAQPSSAFLAQIQKTRGEMQHPDIEVRKEARTLVHDSLRNIITDMICEADASTMVIVADGLRAFRVSAVGEVDWRYDGSGDDRAVEVLSKGKNKDRVEAILARAAEAGQSVPKVVPAYSTNQISEMLRQRQWAAG